MEYISNSYVINLDTSVERLKFMKKQQPQLGTTTPFIRISAINGKHLTDEELQKYTSKWFYQFGSRNSVGCFLSHRKVWQTIIDNNDTYALVMEDDCKLTKHFSKRLNKRMKELLKIDPDWEFLYAGCFGIAKADKQYNVLQYGMKLVVPKIKKSIQPARKYVYIPESPLGFHCYVISQKCAHRLLNILQKISTHMDLMFLYHANEFNIYASIKQLAYQYSTSQNSTIAKINFPSLINKHLDNIKDDYNLSYSFYFNYPIAHISEFPINYYLVFLSTIILLFPMKYTLQLVSVIFIYLLLEFNINPYNYQYILFWIVCISIIYYIKSKYMAPILNSNFYYLLPSHYINH